MALFYITEADPPSKQAILKSALDAFVRDGISGTSVRAIADAAGYTNPALFKFFKSKDELALYLFERCYTENAGVLERALAPPGSFSTKLHRALQALTEFVQQHADAFFFVQDNLRVLWPKLPKSARRVSMLRLFRDLLEDGRMQGVVRDDIALELQVAALVGFLSQTARMHYFSELSCGIVEYVDDLHVMILSMFEK